jgi:hypothetical protein
LPLISRGARELNIDITSVMRCNYLIFISKKVKEFPDVRGVVQKALENKLFLHSAAQHKSRLRRAKILGSQ